MMARAFAAPTSRPELRKIVPHLNVEAYLDLKMQPYEISQGRNL